jgi:hypothetical protein
MLRFRAGRGALVSVGLCLLMSTSVFAADDYGFMNVMLNWFMRQNQEAAINGSFNQVNGVTNANIAAGNINNQIAQTTVSFGGSASGLAADNSLMHQGYAGFFIVGNSVFGNGFFSQDIYPDNNRLVVIQQTRGFIVDARNTSGHVEISHSFQGYAGVATVNQTAGNLNNQATIAMVMSNPNQRLSSVHAGSPLRVYSNLRDNLLLLNKRSSYEAVIDGGSFRNYSGMLAVSQTAGNLNNTANFVGLSMNAAPEHSQALSNKSLKNVTAFSKNNTIVVEEKGKRPEAKIEHGAFQNFTGVASISQVAGNMNQVATQVGVSVR